MQDALKWLVRTALTAVFWVFLLSVNVGGRTMFSRAHAVLVDNSLVNGIDEQLADWWGQFTKVARATIRKHVGDQRA